MSGYNIKWIWDQQISAVQKLVLFALNEHCNPAHGDWRCFPSQKTLSKLTGLSDRAIRVNMIELQKAGLITVAHQHDEAGRQKVNLYWLNAPFIGGQEGADSSENSLSGTRNQIPPTRKESRGGGGTTFGGEAERRSDELLNIETLIVKKEKNGDEYAADFLAFWDAWPGKDPKGSKAQAYAEWRKLKKPSPDDLLKAAQAQAREKQAAKLNGEFSAPFKHVCRWLKGREWENDSSLITSSEILTAPRVSRAMGSWR